MEYYFAIGIIIGLILIIYSIIKIIKITKLKQAKATILGNHFNMRRNDEQVTRIEYEINNIRRECDLNYYSIFLKKGKKLTYIIILIIVMKFIISKNIFLHFY